MDFEEDAFLRCFLEEPEVEKIKKWCEENGHTRAVVLETRFSTSDKLKEEGNEFFNKGEFENALQRYFASMHQLDFHLGQEWDTMPKYRNSLNQRKTKVIRNVSVTYLKMNDNVACKNATDKGLQHIEGCRVYDVQRIERNKAHGDIEPDDPEKETRLAEEKKLESKFHYLKAQGNMNRGFSEDAVTGYKKALELDPDNTAITKAMQSAQRTQKTDRQEAKKVWKEKLLTDDEKSLLLPWWHPMSLLTKCKHRCRGRNTPEAIGKKQR